MTAETGNFQPFPSAWKKTKGSLGSSDLLPVSLRQLQFDMLGRGRVLEGSRDGGEEGQGCVWGAGQELEVQPFCTGWACCVLSKPGTGAEQLSLTFATKDRILLAPVSDIVIRAVRDSNLF